MLSWLLGRSPEIPTQAYEEIDRAEVLRRLVGPPAPNLRQTLPGCPERVEHTRIWIGRVRLAEAMTPCDQVVRSPFFRDRDFGDETA